MTYSTTDYGYNIILDAGDEVIRCLIQFAREEEVDTAFVSGIGSVSEVELGTGAAGRNERRGRLAGPLETCSLTGTLTLVDGQPFPHLHGSFARQDYSLVGGHVYQAVCATRLELAIQLTADTQQGPIAAGRTERNQRN